LRKDCNEQNIEAGRQKSPFINEKNGGIEAHQEKHHKAEEHKRKNLTYQRIGSDCHFQQPVKRHGPGLINIDTKQLWMDE
jgi:hypothetical protein